MSMSPILVTGAGGFVCSEIARALQRAGAPVIAVDQSFDAATAARLSDIRRVEGDVKEVLSDAIGPLSAVIHGAAITASPERLGITGADHIRRNMDLHTHAMAFARRAGATRFLFLSSMGVFEPDDTPTPKNRVTEATVPSATCTYCAAKHAGELLTTSASEDGFETLSLRLGNIFGPHEAVRQTRQVLCLVSRMLAEARSDGVITVRTPEAVREWSWLPDLAKAIAGLTLEAKWHGAPVVHAGSPPIVADLDLARAIAERVSSTTMRLASPPHAAIRPPMATDYDTLGNVAWTPILEALDHLIAQETLT